MTQRPDEALETEDVNKNQTAAAAPSLFTRMIELLRSNIAFSSECIARQPTQSFKAMMKLDAR